MKTKRLDLQTIKNGQKVKLWYGGYTFCERCNLILGDKDTEIGWNDVGIVRIKKNKAIVDFNGITEEIATIENGKLVPFYWTPHKNYKLFNSKKECKHLEQAQVVIGKLKELAKKVRTHSKYCFQYHEGFLNRINREIAYLLGVVDRLSGVPAKMPSKLPNPQCYYHGVYHNGWFDRYEGFDDYVTKKCVEAFMKVLDEFKYPEFIPVMASPKLTHVVQEYYAHRRKCR